MNKLHILTLACLLFVSTLALSNVRSAVYAQEKESTQSASLENIKKIIKENISKGTVRGAIDNLLNRRTAIIGEVTRVTDETITITNATGTRIIPTDQTLLITREEKEIQKSEIAVENWATVLGKLTDDTFSPVFLYIHTKSILPKTQYVTIGTITEITKNTITLIPRSQPEEKTITIVTTTDFETLDGSPAALKDLSEDITVLVSGYETDSKIEAATIRSLAPVVEDN